MAIETKEITFEREIEYSLLDHGGYIKGNPRDYNREFAVDTKLLFRFLQESQPAEWAKLCKKHGDDVETGFLKKLYRDLDTHGMLYVFRHGIVDAPAKLSMCFFKPASGMNQTSQALYEKNILSITRQVHYSLKNENSIDVVLFINGLPVATLELKNPATGQTVENAKHQYMKDRDPRELLLSFKSRCLVHFAVDTDEVWMTTKLDGNLAQKTQIIVEHFRTVTKNKIGGKAKAMVVTGSRLHAVRYYQEFQRYIKKMGYENELGILIAFSGTVRDGGEEYTEVSLNGIKESELPEKFHGGEYQVLLVAEKYQTGFDEPLLHTMFVDKKLSGVKAVQTLSRLNRTCFGKEDTFVLDFVNSAEDIRAAFAPYYEETTIEETTDANIVYELKSKLDEFRVYWASEIESFAKVFFKPGKKQGNMDFGILNSFLDPAVDRYKGLDENEQEEFKSTLTKFVRAYTFLTNIIRLDDADLHKFHAYAKFLQNKLPKREGGGQVFLDDEVALQYYRVQKIFEGSIALEQSDPLPNKIHPGKPKLEEEKAPLSELIDKINEKFGTEFTNIDKVLEQIVSDMDANEELRIQARNNSQEHFRFPFNDAFMDVVIGRMAQNQQFCERVLDDAKFGDTVRDLLIGVVYDRLRRPTDAQL